MTLRTHKYIFTLMCVVNLMLVLQVFSFCHHLSGCCHHDFIYMTTCGTSKKLKHISCSYTHLYIFIYQHILPHIFYSSTWTSFAAFITCILESIAKGLHLCLYIYVCAFCCKKICKAKTIKKRYVSHF